MGAIFDNKGNGGSCSFSGEYIQPSGYVEGNSCQDWVDLHFQAQPPVAHIGTSDAFGLYRNGHTITNPSIDGWMTQGANGDTADKLEWRKNGTLINTQQPAVYDTHYTYTDNNNITTDTTYEVRAYDTAGRTGNASGSYTFTYPYFATTVDITTLTEQNLISINSSYFQADMVAEDSSNKQTADFETSNITLTGIQFYNTVSGAWEWLGGSKSNSLTYFDTSSVTHTVEGNVVNYTRYTHNSVTTGARKLRFWRV